MTNSGEKTLQKNIRYEWGNVNVNEFLQKLSKEGITDAKVESIGSSVMIHLVIFSNIRWSF